MQYGRPHLKISIQISQALRGRAKAITKSRQSNYLIGRLALVIDFTQ